MRLSSAQILLFWVRSARSTLSKTWRYIKHGDGNRENYLKHTFYWFGDYRRFYIHKSTIQIGFRFFIWISEYYTEFACSYLEVFLIDRVVFLVTLVPSGRKWIIQNQNFKCQKLLLGTFLHPKVDTFFHIFLCLTTYQKLVLFVGIP